MSQKSLNSNLSLKIIWRCQTSYETCYSSFLTAKYLVPQGLILGPILSNIFIGDMSSITPNSNCMQYADDSAIHWSCQINQKDAYIKELEKVSHLRNGQSRLTFYSTLVKQNLCYLCYLQQNKCRYGINSQTINLRFATNGIKLEREWMETTLV